MNLTAFHCTFSSSMPWSSPFPWHPCARPQRCSGPPRAAVWDWLLLRVAPIPAVLAHANDARTLLPWAWALFGASLAAGIRHRYLPRRRMAVRLGSGWGLAGACLLPTGPPAIASLGTASGPDSKKARKISCDLPGPHGARRGLEPPPRRCHPCQKSLDSGVFCCLLFQEETKEACCSAHATNAKRPHGKPESWVRRYGQGLPVLPQRSPAGDVRA